MLDEIVNHKLNLLDGLDLKNAIASIQRSLTGLNPTTSLRESLIADNNVSVIAEVKRRSPSRGSLASSLSVEDTVTAYETGGARGISILTDSRYFGGSAEDLMTAKHVTPLPVLRKEFIVHEYQVWESRLIGADAILLIAAILDPSAMKRLYSLAGSIGLEVLVEVHSESEIDRVGLLDPRIIGINNRDLASFTVDLATTERLRKYIPEHITCVSESGIACREDMVRLQEWGIDAALIGEALVASDDPAGKIRELTGEHNDPH